MQDAVRPWHQTQSFKSQAVGATFGASGKEGDVEGKGKMPWTSQPKGGKSDGKGKKGIMDVKGSQKGKMKGQPAQMPPHQRTIADSIDDDVLSRIL